MKSLYVAALAVGVFASANATQTRERLEVVYRPQADGYRLYIFEPQSLSCGVGGEKELKALRLIEPAAPGDPIVVECSDR